MSKYFIKYQLKNRTERPTTMEPNNLTKILLAVSYLRPWTKHLAKIKKSIKFSQDHKYISIKPPKN